MLALIAGLCRAYCRTLRVRLALPDGGGADLARFRHDPVVYAHFERDLLALAAAVAHAPLTVMVARSREGDLGSRILESLGSDVIRGSSLHSGSRALRALVRSLRHSTRPAALCVDGPVGPPGGVKPGVVLCARELGRSIVPVGAAARPRLPFPGSWSGIYLPLPFARCRIVLGEALTVPGDSRRCRLEELAGELGRRMISAQQHAEELVQE